MCTHVSVCGGVCVCAGGGGVWMCIRVSVSMYTCVGVCTRVWRSCDSL